MIILENKTKQIQQGPWPRSALTVDREPRSVIHSVFWSLKDKNKTKNVQVLILALMELSLFGVTLTK